MVALAWVVVTEGVSSRKGQGYFGIPLLSAYIFWEVELTDFADGLIKLKKNTLIHQSQNC